jgi:PAS domain S-box-containing protein
VATYTTAERIFQVLFAPSTFEKSEKFRGILRRVLYAGLRWGGVAGALGLFLYVSVEVLALGRPVVWGQGAGETAETVAIAEDLLLFVLCGAAAVLPTFRPTLTQGRALGAAGTVVGAGIFLRSDLAQGMMVEIEFIALLYLLAVVVVPFRPWQALAVGAGVGLVFLLHTEFGWATPVENPGSLRFGNYALELGASLGLGLVISTSLYATRLAQYRVSQAANRALQEERDRFETLFNSLPTPVVHGWHREGDFIVEDVNDAFEDTFGHRKDEVEGEALGGPPAPKTRQEDARQMPQRVVAEDLQKAERGRMTTEGDRTFQIDFAIQHKENGPHREYRIYTDITDRKRREERIRQAKEDAEAARIEAEKAQAEAEEASRMKSAMLANMSHEIRTPLTSIIGFAEAIETEVSSSHSSQEEADEVKLNRFAGLIGKSSRRLLETLDGVLNLSKLEAGRMEIDSEPVDLKAEAEALTDEVRPRAERAGVDCRIETGGDPVLAQADGSGVQIALRNLIRNAIKYTERGGDVQVRAYQEDGRGDGAAVLEVEDSGSGMDPGAVDRLFQAFRQESEGRAREREGTGIGLTVTQKVVQQMGGTIEVSTEKGKGSCFSIRLPKPGGSASAGGEEDDLENARESLRKTHARACGSARGGGDCPG